MENIKKDKLVIGLPLYWLDWHGPTPVRPDEFGGGMCEWNWIEAKRVHANILCVLYQAKNEDGSVVTGNPTPARLNQLTDKMKYELRESKKSGIAIIGFEDSVQFTSDMASEMGYTVDQLAAVLPDGKYAYTTAWNSGSYIACINSPEWTSWQTENMAIMAEAGFSCVQYDFHPFAAAGYFCQCNNCKEKWDSYCIDNLGRMEKMPTVSIDFKSETGRAFFRWKIKSITDFIQATAAKARKINPGFKICMNQNANMYSFALEALYGAWEIPSTEFHGLYNGDESTMHMYALAEGLGFSSIYGIYNNASQIHPDYRYKVNLAEGFASIGRVTYTAESAEIGERMFNYAYENPEIFMTESAARAAVLYSAESSVFSIPMYFFNTGNQLHTFKTDYARQAATALMKAGISYDYLVIDKNDSINKLNRYDLLLIPAYTYFDNSLWEPIIREAVKKGSTILCMGDDAKKYTESLGFQTEPNVIEIKGLKKKSQSEASFEPDSTFLEAVRKTMSSQIVSLSVDHDNTSVTIRKSDDNHTFIHVVRRGSEKNGEIWQQTIRHLIDSEKTVTDVKVECPFSDGYKVNYTWDVSDSMLSVDIKDYDTYAIIRITTE